MIGREGPVEIITAIFAGLTALAAAILGPLLARRTKQVRDTAQAVHKELDTGNGKSVGRTVAEVHETAQHNATKLDQSSLEQHVQETNSLIRRLAEHQDKPPPI